MGLFINQIEAAKIAYRDNFKNEPTALILDNEMFGVLVSELVEMGDEKVFSISTYRGMQVVVITDQHEGQCSWALGIWGT